ncbi:MAG: 3-hydroxyacyl-CoA dehydrogenase NAD-binding domain-containing protein [Actinomycetota bacterium]|nr:3-hydroxyacyl-CoA dehydrogenase NAD-binding domain-containing protein [Actinomycetota bacterium]
MTETTADLVNATRESHDTKGERATLIQRVGIVGAGVMGRSIAEAVIYGGFEVVLYDVNLPFAKAQQELTLGQVAKRIEAGKAPGLSIEQVHLLVVDAIEDMADCNLIIEAVAEDLALKQSLFAKLEKHLASGAILATNTSSLSPNAIFNALSDPTRTIGLHFFNPATHMKLVEIVPTQTTSKETIEATFEFAKKIGKTAVQAQVSPGFIVNRVARPFYSGGWRLLDESSLTPSEIDRLMVQCGGFRMGPFELMDLIGHDVNLAVTNSVFEQLYFDARYRPSIRQRELVAAGHLGRKSGRGIYSYDDGGGAKREVATASSIPADSSNIEPSDEDRGHGFTFNGVIGEELAPLLKNSNLTLAFNHGPDSHLLDGTTITITDGRCANELEIVHGGKGAIVLDFYVDVDKTSAIAFARSKQVTDQQVEQVRSLLKSCGIELIEVDDVPGLVVARAISPIVNIACEIEGAKIASAADIDIAMRLGVNYPLGPFEFASKIGASKILDLMLRLSHFYGDSYFSPSIHLRRLAAS